MAKFQVSIWKLEFQLVKLELKSFKRVNRATARHCARPRPYRRLNAGERLHVSSIPTILIVRAPLLSSRAPSKLPVPRSPSSRRERTERTLARRAGRRSSSRRPTLATPLRFVAPRAAQPRRPPTPTTHERGRAPTPTNRAADRPDRHCSSPELRLSADDLPPGHPPPQIEPW